MASHKNGQIQARHNSERDLGSTTTGLRNTGLETERDGLLYVPESFNPKSPSPLIVTLHGAGGTAHHGIDPLKELADRTGTILLAPESQGETWDVLLGGFGPDVFFIDEALNDVFSLYKIDPSRIAVAGFSDGASYAIKLAAANNDLFSHVIAFSPSLGSADDIREAPPMFISHGTQDEVLPIDDCSRKLIPQLKANGIEVDFSEFDGGHTIPTEIGRKAFTWFLGLDAAVETRGAKVRSAETGIEFT